MLPPYRRFSFSSAVSIARIIATDRRNLSRMCSRRGSFRALLRPRGAVTHGNITRDKVERSREQIIYDVILWHPVSRRLISLHETLPMLSKRRQLASRSDRVSRYVLPGATRLPLNNITIRALTSPSPPPRLRRRFSSDGRSVFANMLRHSFNWRDDLLISPIMKWWRRFACFS